jgi:hypothetical protein
MKPKIIAMAIAVLIPALVSTGARAGSGSEEWKCSLMGDCSAYFAMIVCPPTDQHPAGICTRCPETYQMWTCSGFIAASCTPQFTELKCGMMEAGNCNAATGLCEHWTSSTTECGRQRWCQ